MRAPQKTVYPRRVSVITGDILAKLGMAKLTLQQIVAEHGVFGQCAADGQQRGGIVNALTHKGAAAEYILIEFLRGGAVAVCPAHAAKQRGDGSNQQQRAEQSGVKRVHPPSPPRSKESVAHGAPSASSIVSRPCRA